MRFVSLVMWIPNTSGRLGVNAPEKPGYRADYLIRPSILRKSSESFPKQSSDRPKLREYVIRSESKGHSLSGYRSNRVLRDAGLVRNRGEQGRRRDSLLHHTSIRKNLMFYALTPQYLPT